jgi:hypothetical protein
MIAVVMQHPSHAGIIADAPPFGNEFSIRANPLPKGGKPSSANRGKNRGIIAARLWIICGKKVDILVCLENVFFILVSR